MERIELAASIFKKFHWAVDKASLERELNSYRVGNEYNAGVLGSAPDLAQTVLAVSIMHELGVPIPLVVSKLLKRDVVFALLDRQPQDLSTIVSLLISLSAGDASHYATQIMATLSWINSIKADVSPPAQLALSTSLAPVAATVHDPHWAGISLCRGVTISNGEVVVSSSSNPDPQLTVDAVSLGCISKPSYPPVTTDGWPNIVAISENLQASIDGLRLASEVEEEGQFTTGIKTELTKVWIPDSNHNPGEIGGIVEIEPLLGLKSTAPPGLQAQVASALTNPNPSNIALLAGALFVGKRFSIQEVRIAASLARKLPSGGIGEALTLELLSELATSRYLHLEAIQALAGYQVTRGVYSIAAHGRPSIWASIIGDWVVKQQVPLKKLESIGQCSSITSCSETSSNGRKTLQPSLQIAAAIIAADAGKFPLSV